jgi:hypothetical protein
MSKLNKEAHFLRIRFIDESKNNSNCEVTISFPEELKKFSAEFTTHIKECNTLSDEGKQGTMVALPYESMNNIVTEILETAQSQILKVKVLKVHEQPKPTIGSGSGGSLSGGFSSGLGGGYVSAKP